MLALPVHPRLAAMLAAEPSSLGVRDRRPARRARRPARHDPTSCRATSPSGSVQSPAWRATNAPTGVPSIGHASRAADLARRLGIAFDTSAIDPDRAGAVLLHAYPDRLAGRRRPGQFQLRSGTAAWLSDRDPLAHEEFVVAADLDGRRDRSRIRLAAALDADEVGARAGRPGQRDRSESSGTPSATTSSNASSAGWSRCDSARPCVRHGRGDDATRALLARVTATGLAVLGWNAASLALRAARRVPAPHVRRAVA